MRSKSWSKKEIRIWGVQVKISFKRIWQSLTTEKPLVQKPPQSSILSMTPQMKVANLTPLKEAMWALICSLKYQRSQKWACRCSKEAQVQQLFCQIQTSGSTFCENLKIWMRMPILCTSVVSALLSLKTTQKIVKVWLNLHQLRVYHQIPSQKLDSRKSMTMTLEM